MELRDLQKQIKILATLDLAAAPVVSCYLNGEDGDSSYGKTLVEEGRLLRRGLSGETLWQVEEALSEIKNFLATEPLTQTKGVALFARGGERPFFLPLKFRVPLPNCIAASASPCLYHLADLQDTYSCFAVMHATENCVRILGVHLGSVVEDIWNRRSESRSRIGREWTKQHHEKHKLQRIHQFVIEQIRVLDRVITRRNYGHLFLAGNPRVTSQIKKALPHDLAAKLVGVLPASDHDRTTDIVAAAVASFVEQEEQESLARVGKLLYGINTHGLAVAGTRASIKALSNGQVDVLVVAKDYEPDLGFACAACGAIDVAHGTPGGCRACGARQTRELNIKEEMVRMAEQIGSEIETVSHSDALMRIGGVGCLLRFLQPENYRARAA